MTKGIKTTSSSHPSGEIAGTGAPTAGESMQPTLAVATRAALAAMKSSGTADTLRRLT